MSTPRVLVILSNDYGELFNAMYFLAGTPVEAHLALPPRLLETSAGQLGHATYGYRGAGDLDALVATLQPDAVLLMSGYLLTVNRLLAEADIASLVRAWQARGVRLATSDPALGLLSSIDVKTFSAKHPSQVWLDDHFRRLAALFADVWHLYLAPEPRQVRAPFGSYFNPCFASQYAAADGGPASGPGATWLFLLSPEDYLLQAQAQGRRAFAESLAAWVQSARAGGRRPSLIVPSQLREDIGRLATDVANLFLPPQSLPDFLRALLAAELVFYWNVYSASILGRVAAESPFFAFDRGHLVRAMPEIESFGQRHFYAGRDVELLEFCRPLPCGELMQQANRQREQLLLPTLRHLERSPLPEELLGRIIAG